MKWYERLGFRKLDMSHNEADKRCLIFGIKELLKDARLTNITPVAYEDNHWKISIKRKQSKEEGDDKNENR